MLARYEDRPGNYPGAWHPDSTCSGTYNNGGAVMVFATVLCGDGTCAPDETCENCEADCGACPDVFVPDPEAVAPLVALLGCGVDETATHAQGALLNIAAPSAENRRGAGVVKPLVALLEGHSDLLDKLSYKRC